MKEVGLSLDAQIDRVALRLAEQHKALRENLALTQVHARELICTHPLLAVGLVVALVWLWSRVRNEE
ncbi:MAG: hypothetical protein ORN29_10265 [Rhodoferax sp.]|nr:hypothetical protein [Rhodoferax sp.]